MRIDLHTHLFPHEYLSLLEDRGQGVWIRTDSEGRRYIEEGGTRLATLTPPMLEVETRLDAMDREGIDVQVLSLTSPNVYCFEAHDAVRAARLVNDAYAALKARHPRRFLALASVPLGSGEELGELDRALDSLGLDGVVVGTNVGGKELDDPAFEPFWRRVAELGRPVLVHPMAPVAGTAGMERFSLVPLIGFPFETTLCLARLIWSGLMDRYPGLRIIAVHAGGAAPYLAGRLEIGTDAYAECRGIELRPLDYLRRFWYDPVSYHPPALRLLRDTVGVERIVFGTDYPHVIGDPARVRRSLEEVFGPEEQEAIGWRNASRLGLEVPPARE
jgi:aminocarboxymuconate-semialdehyde decarboxylase